MPLVRITSSCTRCNQASTGDFFEIVVGRLKCDNCGVVIGEFFAFPGYVYVLGNPTYPEILKIGLTHRSPEDRVAELSASTGVPTQFVLHAYWPSLNPADDEAKIHARFSNERVSDGREFFQLGLLNAIDAISNETAEAPVFLSGEAQALLKTRNDELVAIERESELVLEKTRMLRELDESIQRARIEGDALAKQTELKRKELERLKSDISVFRQSARREAKREIKARASRL